MSALRPLLDSLASSSSIDSFLHSLQTTTGSKLRNAGGTTTATFFTSSSQPEKSIPDLNSAFSNADDAQAAIESINSRVKSLFHDEFGQNYKRLREAAIARGETWKTHVLSPDGLAYQCRRLKLLADQIDETGEACARAQKLWSENGAEMLSEGKGLPKVKACADTNYKDDLVPKVVFEIRIN